MKGCLILQGKQQIQIYSTNIRERTLYRHQTRFYETGGKTAKCKILQRCSLF